MKNERFLWQMNRWILNQKEEKSEKKKRIKTIVITFAYLYIINV